jgi:hypothetical protein
MTATHTRTTRPARRPVEIRQAEGGLTVTLFCECGQLLAVDFTAQFSGDEVAADQALSDRLMTALIRRAGDGTCPACDARATTASVAHPALEAVEV